MHLAEPVTADGARQGVVHGPHRPPVEVGQVPVDGRQGQAEGVAPVGQADAAGPAGLLLEEAAHQDAVDRALVAGAEADHAGQRRRLGGQRRQGPGVEAPDPPAGRPAQRRHALGHRVEHHRLEPHVAVEHAGRLLGGLVEPDAPAHAPRAVELPGPVARRRQPPGGGIDGDLGGEALGVVLEVAAHHVVPVAQAGWAARPAGQQQPGVLDGTTGQHDHGCPHPEPAAVQRGHVDAVDPLAPVVQVHLGDVGQRDEVDAVARPQPAAQQLAEAQRVGVLVEDQGSQAVTVESEAVVGRGAGPVVGGRPRAVEQGGRPLVATPQVGRVERPARVGNPGPLPQVDVVERGLAARPGVGGAAEPPLAAGPVDVVAGALDRGERGGDVVGHHPAALEHGDAQAPPGERERGGGAGRARADDADGVVEHGTVGEPAGVVHGQRSRRPGAACHLAQPAGHAGSCAVPCAVHGTASVRRPFRPGARREGPHRKLGCYQSPLAWMHSTSPSR